MNQEKRKLIRAKNHPRNHSKGYIYEQRYIVENVIGKILPKGSEIHHVDGNAINNSNSNLVVCQDRGYHYLLHRKTRALKSCGHANWRKCHYCKKYDSPENLYITKRNARHRSCHNEYKKGLKEKYG